MGILLIICAGYIDGTSPLIRPTVHHISANFDADFYRQFHDDYAQKARRDTLKFYDRAEKCFVI